MRKFDCKLDPVQNQSFRIEHRLEKGDACRRAIRPRDTVFERVEANPKTKVGKQS
jgi:hypothetical protein